MQEMHGTVMHYPWGTTDAIPGILGVPTDGRPHAEYWLGAHPLAPSSVEGRRLDALIAEDPSLLGPRAAEAFGGRLPFMMKLLSARHALSLQAHPSRDAAQQGYHREQAAGIPLDDAERTYKDDLAKPELLIALTDFSLLVGFREQQRTLDLFEDLGVGAPVLSLISALDMRPGPAGTQQVFLEVLSLADERLDDVTLLLVAAVAHVKDEGPVGELARLIVELDEHFPGDPGILAACLMNQVRLRPGEAAFIPAGTMHADLKGTGVEVLANSDNVIRGGLTNKHIAVDELVRVVDFNDQSPEVLRGEQVAPGVWSYAPDCPEFAVWRIESSETQTPIPADKSVRIALVTRGEATLVDDGRATQVEHGQAFLLPASNAPVSVTGDAELFIAAPGIR